MVTANITIDPVLTMTSLQTLTEFHIRDGQDEEADSYGDEHKVAHSYNLLIAVNRLGASPGEAGYR